MTDKKTIAHGPAKPGLVIFAKELVIKKALDHYFPGEWNEAHISHKGQLTYAQDGTETFEMDGVSLVRFYPMRTHITIDDGDVIIEISQDHEILYE